MFTELPQLYEAFTAARADEALIVVTMIGDREWLWFSLGLFPVATLIASIRVARLIPHEQTWQLSVLRVVASLFNYTILGSVLVICFYLYFSHVGGHLIWPRNISQQFWPYVKYHAVFSLYGIGSGLVLGVFAWSIIARRLEPLVVSNLEKKTNKIKNSDGLTDVRNIEYCLPSLKGKIIDHSAFFLFASKQNSIFLGVDQHGKAVLISNNNWNKSHVQICGPTGTGKGIQAAVVLVQALMKGDAVYIFDSKKDEWAASVIAEQCEKLDIPFIYVNLRESVPQINIIRGATSVEVFELFVAGFGLDEKGEAADFYRIDDREAAYQLAQVIEKYPDISLPELYEISIEILDPELYESAKGFIARLKQLARVTALHTREGVDLSSILSQGGAIYVVGAMRGQEIPALQKIIALRVIQIIENQISPERHASIFLDEIKYLLSSPTVNAFGTIRDKNANLILTHQSLQDFRDCGKDLSPDAVEGAIRINTQLKWIYRATDPATAEWAAKMSGKIIVNKERRIVNRNEFLSETTRSERMLDQVERYQFDENTILHLPDGCALYIGVGRAQLALAQPIPTIKREFKILPAKGIEYRQPGQELLESAADLVPNIKTTEVSEELL